MRRMKYSPIGRRLVATVVLITCLAISGRSLAFETTWVDDEGKPVWLYTPTERPDPAKTYWLVVGVHGVSDDGHLACGAATLVDAFDDVIVLGPTFSSGRPAAATQAGATTAPAGTDPSNASATQQTPATQPAATRPRRMPGGSYQMSGPTHEAKLERLIAGVGRTWTLRPKIVLHGFSAGAQFVHRFAMRHPDRVAAVSAHSAGSWAKLTGSDRINDAAKGIPFAISCGEADKGRGGPAGTPTRIEGAKRFADDLKSLGFEVTLATWPRVGHEQRPEQSAMTAAIIKTLKSQE